MKAIVLSAGGGKGAYQVGALNYIINESNITYDIFCGVSVGAINCAFLSMFPAGQEKEAANGLVNLWKKIDTFKIYQRWFPFGRLHALWKLSFYDSSPLNDLIRSNIDINRIRSSGKKISVGTVSINSGKYTIFNQDSPHFMDAVVASSSFPGMFSPVKFMNQLWTDGGIKEISPIKTAIEMGANSVDVIVTSPEFRIKKFIDHPTTVDLLKRSLDLATDRLAANDIERVELYNILAKEGLGGKKLVNLKIIRPDNNLIEDVLDFNHDKIMEMMNKGYNDAKNKYHTIT